MLGTPVCLPISFLRLFHLPISDESFSLLPRVFLLLPPGVTVTSFLSAFPSASIPSPDRHPRSQTTHDTHAYASPHIRRWIYRRMRDRTTTWMKTINDSRASPLLTIPVALFYLPVPSPQPY
jgi:hypothetical protein